MNRARRVRPQVTDDIVIDSDGSSDSEHESDKELSDVRFTSEEEGEEEEEEEEDSGVEEVSLSPR